MRRILGLALATGLAAAGLSPAPALAQGDFLVTLLGTASPAPRPTRSGPSTLIEAGDQKVLVDAGRGVPARLWQMGVPIGSLDAVVLTHFHSDHTAGLPDVWLTGWIGTPYGGREEAFRVIGPVGTTTLMEGLQTAYQADIDIRLVDEGNPPVGIAVETTEFAEPGVIEGPAAAAALARPYAAARLHVNLFQPSFKLREKTRIGARVTKRWHAPATPADRALAGGRLDAASAMRIQGLRTRADPVIALAAIRAAQAELGPRVDRRGTGPVEAEAPIVIDIAAALDGAARNGEQRSIHRRPYRRVKPIPQRPSKLDPHRSEIDGWLDSEPAITAVEVLARLRARYPDRFTEKHLRSTQRLVKAWRADQAKRVIRCGTAALEATIATVAPARPL
jgi:ribonuclease BN (tRNA processing enzyme)